MENDPIEELLKIVLEYLQSDEGNFSGAVDLATNFSTKNSIPSDRLLDQSNSYGSKGSHELAYIFAKTAASSSTGSTKADAHFTAGCASDFMGWKEEAEEQYKLALEADPRNSIIHYNYGSFLKKIERYIEAEEHFILAIEFNPENVSAHYNYGNLLDQMGRRKEAEEQYEIAIKLDPKHVNAHSNYGVLLAIDGNFEEAEKQYKMAIKLDPNNVNAHSNYGNLLAVLGREKEGKKKDAEEHYKIAIKLDPKSANTHGAYSFLLYSMNSEDEAIREVKIASSLYRENGDYINERLLPAWLYEMFAEKYYSSGKYRKSGEFAEISGSEYIEVGKQVGEKFKGTSLTKGYTLKGRAKIRKLELKPPYDVEMFTEIMDGIYEASKCYKKAAEASPKDNQACNACSISMLCLSEMLDYMIAVIKQERVPRLEGEIERWKKELAIPEEIYKGSGKGEQFIKSLHKLMACIQNLEGYKKYGMRKEERAFEECVGELREIAGNIEGPLQKIIDDSAKQMDICRRKIMPYAGIETGKFEPQTHKIEAPDTHTYPKPDHESKPKTGKINQLLKWILDPIKIIAGVIFTIVLNHYSEYLFSLIQGFVSILFS